MALETRGIRGNVIENTLKTQIYSLLANAQIKVDNKQLKADLKDKDIEGAVIDDSTINVTFR